MRFEKPLPICLMPNDRSNHSASYVSRSDRPDARQHGKPLLHRERVELHDRLRQPHALELVRAIPASLDLPEWGRRKGARTRLQSGFQSNGTS